VDAVLKRHGKIVGESHSEVSADGKVTKLTGKGTSPDGKEYSLDAEYDKK
jgi:hypothetical protein